MHDQHEEFCSIDGKARCKALPADSGRSRGWKNICYLHGTNSLSEGIQRGHDNSELSEGSLLVLGPDGEVEVLDLLNELLVGGDGGLLGVLAAGSGGNGVKVEAEGADLATELLLGLGPVLLGDVISDGGLDALGSLGDTGLSVVQAGAGLDQTVTLGLVKIQVAGLVDNVEALLHGGAVVNQVDGGQGLGGTDRQNSGTGAQAREDGPAGVLGRGRDHHGAPGGDGGSSAAAAQHVSADGAAPAMTVSCASAVLHCEGEGKATSGDWERRLKYWLDGAIGWPADGSTGVSNTSVLKLCNHDWMKTETSQGQHAGERA